MQQGPPCSLYYPWGVPPEKMMTMPMSYAMADPAQLAAALACQVSAQAAALQQQHAQEQQHQQQQQQQQQHPHQQMLQHSPQTATLPPSSYQHPALHPSANAAVSPYSICGYPVAITNAAGHTTQLAGYPSQFAQLLPSQPPTAQQPQQQQHQTQLQLHPTAAAALLSPLSLQSFLLSQPSGLLQYNAVTPTPTPPSLGSQQFVLTPLQQHKQRLAAATGHATAALANITAGLPMKQLLSPTDATDKPRQQLSEKRKADGTEPVFELKKAKLETKALKAKRPGFTDERYQETSYYIDNGLRKVYPYFFTFTTFTKGRWVGEKILDVFSREFRAHPAEEYERCIEAGTLTVNYEKVPIDYRLKHNDLLANIVHRHEVPVTSQRIRVVHMDEDIVVVNKPASIPVHPCGRYRHNTVVFILAKEFNMKNLRTIHRLDRLTSGLLLFGRNPKKARQMEQQIRNRQVQKEYICRVEGHFPDGVIECNEPIEVVSYKIGVCKVSPKGKDCKTTFQRISEAGNCSIVLCKPLTGRMHQIRVHLQYLGFPIVNDPLYNHVVFGPLKGKGGDVGGKSDDELINELINIHNAENWLGMDGDVDVSLFKTLGTDSSNETASGSTNNDGNDAIVATNVEPIAHLDAALQNDKITTAITASAEVIKTEVTVSTQTSYETPDCAYDSIKMSSDPHCYECKANYRDPRPEDLMMFLHAWKYKGPGWAYETDLPNWASPSWTEKK